MCCYQPDLWRIQTQLHPAQHKDHMTRISHHVQQSVAISLSEADETRNSDLTASGRTYSHFADGGLLQEELEVVDLPGGWGGVCGEDQVRRRRHELQHNAESETGYAARCTCQAQEYILLSLVRNKPPSCFSLHLFYYNLNSSCGQVTLCLLIV